MARSKDNFRADIRDKRRWLLTMSMSGLEQHSSRLFKLRPAIISMLALLEPLRWYRLLLSLDCKSPSHFALISGDFSGASNFAQQELLNETARLGVAPLEPTRREETDARLARVMEEVVCFPFFFYSIDFYEIDEQRCFPRFMISLWKFVFIDQRTKFIKNYRRPSGHLDYYDPVIGMTGDEGEVELR